MNDETEQKYIRSFVQMKVYHYNSSIMRNVTFHSQQKLPLSIGWAKLKVMMIPRKNETLMIKLLLLEAISSKILKICPGEVESFENCFEILGIIMRKGEG
jgi:hypothetical protein